MTEPEADLIMRRIYWLALGFGLPGSLSISGCRDGVQPPGSP